MADAPRFALYVSSVPGRLCSRPGSPHAYLGARIPSPDERKAGESEPSWQPEVVIPILEAEYNRFRREWDALLREGDLEKRTAGDFAAYQAELAKVEVAHVAELEKVAREAKSAEVAKAAEATKAAKA